MARVRQRPEPIRHPQFPRRIEKRPAPQNPLPTIVRVLDPFPHVAEHVIQSECIWRLLGHCMSPIAAVAVVPGCHINSGIHRRIASATCRVFPFRLLRQTHSDSVTVLPGIDPANPIDGTIGAFVQTWIFTCDQCVRSLRNLSLTQPKTPADRLILWPYFPIEAIPISRGASHSIHSSRDQNIFQPVAWIYLQFRRRKQAAEGKQRERTSKLNFQTDAQCGRLPETAPVPSALPA